MIRLITEDSRRATVQWKQPWRWGASCIPTKYQLRRAERAINGASVLIRRRGNGRLCFDPYESACNLTARRGGTIKKGRSTGWERTNLRRHTKGLSPTVFVKGAVIGFVSGQVRIVKRRKTLLYLILRPYAKSPSLLYICTKFLLHSKLHSDFAIIFSFFYYKIN